MVMAAMSCAGTNRVSRSTPPRPRRSLAVPADVDRGLDRSPVGVGQWRIEQFVAGAEQRAADRGIGAPWQDATPRRGHGKGGEASDADGERMDGQRARDAEAAEHRGGEGRLNRERSDAGGGVEQPEEANERRAPGDVRPRPP